MCSRVVQAKPSQALEDCTAAMRHSPNDTRSILRAATCHQKLGQITQALTLVDRASSLTALTASYRATCAAKAAELSSISDACACLWASLLAAETPADALAIECAALDKLRTDDSYAHLHLLAAAAASRGCRWLEARGHLEAADRLPDAAARLQAWWLAADVLFAQGSLAQCADVLGKHLPHLVAFARQPVDTHEPGAVPLPQPPVVATLEGAMRRAVSAKERGNAAIKDRRYSDAAAAYSEAIGEGLVAAPAFLAILFSNRAAAMQVRFLVVVCLFAGAPPSGSSVSLSGVVQTLW
jgi:tetratricopeptide (TPR) repeat protein